MDEMVTQWLEGYRTAWETRDPEAAAALFTDGARYQEQPYEEALAGRDGVRNYWAEVTKTQSDVQFCYGTPLVVGTRAAVEWWVTMRNGGADVTLAGGFHLTFDPSGLCSALREYWHFAEGHHEPPAGWGN